MIWKKPTLNEVKIDAEIGSYNEDDDRRREPPIARGSPADTPTRTQSRLGRVTTPLTAAATFALVLGWFHAAQAFTPVNVPVRNYNPSGTNTNTQESILMQANVASDYFGQLPYSFAVDDAVYAQPLYMSGVTPTTPGWPAGAAPVNMLYVATAKGSVYGFNADTGALIWRNPLAFPVTGAQVGCGDFSGNIAIIGTPVIDASTNTLYVVVHTQLPQNPSQYVLNALDITNGGIVRQAVIDHDLGSGFNSLKENQRSGLAFDRGTVYITFAGFCDAGPYNGRVIAYNGATMMLVNSGLMVTNNKLPLGQGGVWGFGSAPPVDANGNIYVASGNGDFQVTPAGNYSNSVIELSSKNLNVLSTFTPDPSVVPTCNGHAKYASYEDFLTQNDLDLGIAGPVFLANTSKVVQGSKVGLAYVLTAGNLGGYQTNDPSAQEFPVAPFDPNLDLACVGKDDSAGHVTNAVSYWNGKAGNLYFWSSVHICPGTQCAGNPKLYSYNSQGQVNTTSVIENKTLLPDSALGPSSGGVMALSANGTQSGTGVLWSPQSNNATPTQYKLFALSADTLQGLAGTTNNKLWASNLLNGSAHWNPPTVANGHVFTPSLSGTVTVFGLQPPSAPTWSSNSGTASAIGSGWAITNTPIGNGDRTIVQWNPATSMWQTIPGAGAISLSVDLNGTVWVVNKAGVIFKWVNNAFAVFSAPFAAASVASGSNDTETWATKASDQTIWHWTGSQWVQVPGGALKVTVFSAPDPVCNDHLPVVLGGNNSIYFYQHVGGCSGGAFTFSNGGGSDLSTDFVVDATGKIDQWSAGAWHSYVTGPYGTSTKIGAWVGGIFAMSSATGAIQVIQ